jgi:hypothetical protein
LCTLYAAHTDGKATSGIDVPTGAIIDAKEKKIFDIFSGKSLALKLATNVASTILKIDQVIISIVIFITRTLTRSVFRSLWRNRLADRTLRDRRPRMKMMMVTAAWPKEEMKANIIVKC